MMTQETQDLIGRKVDDMQNAEDLRSYVLQLMAELGRHSQSHPQNPGQLFKS